jgi:hypothetical protein
MTPSHGQLLALYFLLVSDSDLRRVLMTSQGKTKALAIADLVNKFNTYLGGIGYGALAAALTSIGDLYVGGSRVLTQDDTRILGALNMTTYDPASGPCPGPGEHAPIIQALNTAFPNPELLRKKSGPRN